MPEKKDPKEVFYNYLPAAAVDYCFQLWIKHDFHFKVSRKRNTKLGDYRYYINEKSHTITVNGDLNPFSFLVTYLHEVAHLLVTVNHKRNVDPHGDEWKSEFKKVADPMLNTTVFPSFILTAFKKYLYNPKASSCSDPELLKALNYFDEESDDKYLGDVEAGKIFIFNNRQFVKESVRRTRVLCKELQTGKKYLISKMAKVNL